MASTRTPGITVDAKGNRIINKEHHGIRLFVRLGNFSQDCAEMRLRSKMERLDLERGTRDLARPCFAIARRAISPNRVKSERQTPSVGMCDC